MSVSVSNFPLPVICKMCKLGVTLDTRDKP